MLRKVNRVIEDVIDVELPVYLRFKPYYIKIISECEYHEIVSGESIGIKYSYGMVDHFLTKGDPSTAEEFYAALAAEKERLHELLNENIVLQLNEAI